MVETPDFTREQHLHVVHGFPITYRPFVYNSQERYWLPRGISRNDAANTWRLWIRHTEGVLDRHIPDAGLHRSESLKKAWLCLVEELKDLIPCGLTDKRELLVGWEREACLDTGVTGVGFSRGARRRVRTVGVYSAHSIDTGSGSFKQVRCHTGNFSESRFYENPGYWEDRFDEAVVEAVAIRRYFNSLVADLRRPTSMLRYEDVPQDIRRKGYDMTLTLEGIFQSMDR